MNVYAVRDDGAMLVTETGRPDDPAVIVLGLNFFPTTQGAALARGEWSEPDGQVIPEPLREPVRGLLQQTAAESDQNKLTITPGMTAAAEVHTGAMIALVPTEEDAERIAIDGGEDADELHLTLMYLGEAALLPSELRHALVDCVAMCVERLPTIVGKIWAVDVFNPTPGQAITAGGSEPCVVWGVDGELVDVVHKSVCYDVEATFQRFGMTPHPQHKPFTAHITATYVDPEDSVDLAAFTTRLGPVTFDRVRLAFGGETYDVPLGDSGDESVGEDELAEDEMTVVAATWDESKHPRGETGTSQGGRFVKKNDNGSSENADYEDAVGMSAAEWAKLSDDQKAALLTAVWVAEGYNRPGAKAALGKLQGFIESGKHKGGGGGGGSGSEKKKPKAKAAASKPRRAKASEATKKEPQDGEVIAETESGDSRMRYAAESKQWVVETRRGGAWRPQRYYNPNEARDLLSRSGDWFDPSSRRAASAVEDMSPKARELTRLLEKTRRERHKPRKAAEVNSIAMTMGEDGILVADVAFDENGEPIVPNVLIDWRAHLAFAKERDVNLPAGPGHQLRDYWVRGPGAAKIGWGTDGSFARCVAQLGKYVARPQGLCAEYHKRATGEWPAEKGVPSEGSTDVLEDGTMLYATDGAARGGNVSETAVVTAADDTKKPYGDVRYADPGYQEDGVKRYPIDTEEHIRAAWSYINMPKNATKYSAADLRKVKARISAAMRRIGADVVAAGRPKAAADCPPGHHKMPDGSCMADEEMSDSAYEGKTIAVDANASPGLSAPWHGVLTVEGIESGDSRMFERDSLMWDNLPLPLRWQKETAHGGQNDVTVEIGNITRVWREAADDGRPVNLIRGEGTIDLENPDGAEVYRRMKKGYMSGGNNSVDVDSVKDADVEMRFAEPKAAAEDGTVDLGAMFARPELTVYKKGRIRATTLVSIPAFTEANLELVSTSQSESDITAADRRMTDLIAATSVIEITDAPPREWFDEPTDVVPSGALTVTPQGRIFGYVAPAGVRHRSFPGRSQYVPLRNVDYSRFMSGETIVADGGRVATGAITMNCGHASTVVPLTAAQASDHYDNSCAIVATARVGENEKGVWMAGALLPGTEPATVQRMMACKLSGDWRAHLDRPGWREFVAALLVPVPGFPMARTAASVEMEDGLLVASSVPVQFAARPAEDDEPEVADDEPEDDDETEEYAVARRAQVAALGRRMRVAQLVSSTVAMRFNPSQPRGDDGRWTDVGGGGGDLGKTAGQLTLPQLKTSARPLKRRKISSFHDYEMSEQVTRYPYGVGAHRTYRDDTDELVEGNVMVGNFSQGGSYRSEDDLTKAVLAEVNSRAKTYGSQDEYERLQGSDAENGLI